MSPVLSVVADDVFALSVDIVREPLLGLGWGKSVENWRKWPQVLLGHDHDFICHHGALVIRVANIVTRYGHGKLGGGNGGSGGGVGGWWWS